MGEYRREMHGSRLEADFFDPESKENVEKREGACRRAMDDLIGWMKENNGRSPSTNNTMSGGNVNVSAAASADAGGGSGAGF